MATLPDFPIAETTPVKQRRRYRVPVGMPRGNQDWRTGSLFSIGFHLVVLLLILSPFAVVSEVLELPQGAGGPGPAGGGGGGTLGSGRIRAEAIKFVQAAPPPPAPTPVKIETPPPEIPKPEVLPLPKPVLEAPKLELTTAPIGVGGGTGADGTTGSGTGTGGGVGTGVGTGRGSAVGPGTGGGGEANYPPTPIEMFLPPLPVPDKLKGFRLIVEFDVDEKGRVLSVVFNETSDRGYNRRLRDVFKGYRFRPGQRPDGTPIRMKGQIIAEL